MFESNIIGLRGSMALCSKDSRPVFESNYIDNNSLIPKEEWS